jgi:hypothetical protein
MMPPLTWQGNENMPEGTVDIQKLIVVLEQQPFEFLNAHVSAISPLLEMTCSMPVGKNPRPTLKQHTYISPSTKLVSCPNQQTYMCFFI